MNEPIDDAVLWDAADDSIAGRALTSLWDVSARARAESRAFAAWASIAGWWSAQQAPVRMRMVGTTVLVATITHMAMNALSGPVGFWWLILPGIAGVFGLVTLALSFSGPTRE
jgi:hypothetical protein